MRKILHIDMDAFFASVEQRDRPELRGKPVIVGGVPQRRGVVSTCSYEAREYGVHSGMSSRTALLRCPEAVFIEPDFRKYRAASAAIHEEFYATTDIVESVSIDEAYLDITGCCSDFSAALACAADLQKRIKLKTELSASAGISYNKFLAKSASDFRKPAGITLITPENSGDFLDHLPVEKFHGIGRISAAKLRKMNIRCGRDLKQLPLETLKGIFGKNGAFYYSIVRGLDDRPVAPEGDPKSLSREVTLYEDCCDLRKIRILIRTLARKVIRRAELRGLTGKSLFIKLKYSDFQTITRSMPFNGDKLSGPALGEAALSLLPRTEAGQRPVRLVGIGISQLIPIGTVEIIQPELKFPRN